MGTGPDKHTGDSAAHREGVSVVIPVYNAEETLPDLVARLLGVLGGLGREHEVILVNDGSSDRSWESIKNLAEGSPRVRGVNLMRNYGQHNALLCGIRNARHAWIVTMDDDLQHPPEEVPTLLAALTEDRDVIYGTPASQPHGLLRGLASIATKWTLQGVMGAEIARQVSAFRVFRMRLRDAFSGYAGSFVSIDVLLTWGTSRFAAVRVRHAPRTKGISGYTFRKLVVHALNMLTGFTTWPLQASSVLGFALTLFGLVVLGFVVIRYLVEGGAPPGFPFLASIIAVFSGAQLFALGMIGEYLARMHFRTMQKPTYTIRGETSEPGSVRNDGQ